MKKALLTACVAGAALTGAGQASAQDAPAPVPAAPAAEAPAPGPPTHTVVSGEYLSKISAARLGTADRWVELFAFNRDVLQNPNLIEVGQVLKIPTEPVPIPPDLLASAAASSSPSRSSSSGGQSSNTRSTGASRSSGGGGAGGDLASIRACESGGDYGAVSGQYRGAYQFDQQTWESVGGSGDPAAASPAEQDARASALKAQRGSSPWPNCG